MRQFFQLSNCNVITFVRLTSLVLTHSQCLLINPATEPSSPVACEFIIGEAGDDAGGHVAEFAPGGEYAVYRSERWYPAREQAILLCFLVGTLFLDYGVGKMRTCNRTVITDAAAAGTSRLLALELKF